MLYSLAQPFCDTVSRFFYPPVHLLRIKEHKILRNTVRQRYYRSNTRLRKGIILLDNPYLLLYAVDAVVGQAVHRKLVNFAEQSETPEIRAASQEQEIVCVPFRLHPTVIFLPVGGVKLPEAFLCRVVYHLYPKHISHEVTEIPGKECAVVPVLLRREYFPAEAFVIAVTLAGICPVGDLLRGIKAAMYRLSAVRGYIPGEKFPLRKVKFVQKPVSDAKMRKPRCQNYHLFLLQRSVICGRI